MSAISHCKHVVLAAMATLMVVVGQEAMGEQRHFPTPKAAVEALVKAAATDAAALADVLGPEVEQLRSGDKVADRDDLKHFVTAAQAGTHIQRRSADLALLSIGRDHWPFPIPLVKDKEGWRFDTAAGKEELLNRRIGRNELHAIATARVYVEAQNEYATKDPMGSGVRQYATRFASSEGKRDGLYWPVAAGQEPSPLGPLVAEAVAEGYQHNASGEPTPYHGYYFRILTAQGAQAPGGARSYMKDGHLSEGFGLLAYPAEYGASGIMSFIVNQQGIVFQKDLGKETKQQALAITEYNPDSSWEPVSDPVL